MEDVNVKELRNQSVRRLEEMASELRVAIRNLRFTVQTRQRSNVRDLRKAKRNLARVNTVMTEQKAKESSK